VALVEHRGVEVMEEMKKRHRHVFESLVTDAARRLFDRD
jgi:hypothetical protein